MVVDPHEAHTFDGKKGNVLKGISLHGGDPEFNRCCPVPVFLEVAIINYESWSKATAHNSHPWVGGFSIQYEVHPSEDVQRVFTSSMRQGKPSATKK